MAVPAHTRLTVRGGFGPAGAAVEEWAFNLNFADQTFSDPAARQTAVNGAFTDIGTSLRPLYSSLITFASVRLARVDGTGHVVKTGAGAYDQADSTNTATAGTAASSLVYPTTSALVISISGARAGATGKGRYFLPMPSYQLDGSTYELNSAQCDSIALAQKTMINALVGRFGSLQVMSSKGYATTVTTVRVGRRPDTQRSRGGAMLEKYSVLAL